LTPSAFGCTLDVELVGWRKKRGALTVALELRRTHMQEWHKPEVVEEQVGLEVTSYLPAELDRD
jgi:coenzyme PQQ precursor peptide PqqA